jgi:hypothetical protein
MISENSFLKVVPINQLLQVEIIMAYSTVQTVIIEKSLTFQYFLTFEI